MCQKGELEMPVVGGFTMTQGNTAYVFRESTRTMGIRYAADVRGWRMRFVVTAFKFKETSYTIHIKFLLEG